MYDALTTTYTLACPHRGEARVKLSSFRALDRLAGAEHPAVYRVVFACGCGEAHPALVSHDDLDWAPLGLQAGSFLNLMTDRLDDAGSELGALAAQRIGAGEWPWSFFCYLEDAPRPVTPSAFRLLAPAAGALGVAIRCPACASTSVNLVTPSHVDVPFHSDTHVAVATHVFAEDELQTVAALTAELGSASFDERCLATDG